MQCLRHSRPLFPSKFPLTFSPPKHSLKLPPKPHLRSSPRMSSTVSARASTIEHIVLFKVKDDTDSARVNTMLSSLNALSSLDSVLHLTAAPLHRNKSSPFAFTHLLHSRYSSKDDLAAYSAHPSHVSVVKESVFPICDDVMAVDWVADGLPPPPPPGGAVRVSFLKVKEGLGEGVKEEILGVIKEVKESVGGIEQITCGQNFSPARAKGYSIASLAVFPGLEELSAADAKEEAIILQKEKVRDYLDGVIVVDFVVPAAQPASL